MSYQKLMTERTFFGSSPFVKLVASSSVRGVMQSLATTNASLITHPPTHSTQLNSTQVIPGKLRSLEMRYEWAIHQEEGICWQNPTKNKQMKHDTSCYHHRQEARCEYLLQEKNKKNLVEVHCHEVGPNRGYRFLLFWLLTGNLTPAREPNQPRPTSSYLLPVVSNVDQVKSGR